MRRIDGELDQLMWLIAEGGDTRAVEEFEERHPDLRYELANRVAMLRGLKSAGKVVHPPARVPAFRPREVRRQAPTRWTIAGVASLGLAALAAASYTVVSFMEPPPRPVVRVAPQPQAVRQVEVPTPTPPQVTPEQPRPVTPTPEDTTPAYLRPQDVKIDHAPLTAALKMIAAQGGLKIEIGPGMDNPDIKIDYRGKTTIEMFQDLGHQFAFTAFDQGDGSVLVIPAVDPSNKVDEQRIGEVLSPKPIDKKAAKSELERMDKAEHRF